MKHSIIKLLTISILFSLIFTGCLSSNQIIPEDMSAKQLIQNGQNSFEKGNYKESLRYYNAVLERYPDDINSYIEAKYEIGHLFIKQKDYAKARPILQEIIDVYKKVMPGQLPAAYEKLAQLELAKIPQ